ncbi:hypothetical protein ACR2XN_28730 [Klebsiella pneumoniae]
MKLEELYGKLKTHEMEQEQRKIIYGAGTVDNKLSELMKTTALTVSNVRETEAKAVRPQNKKNEIFEADMDDGDRSRIMMVKYTTTQERPKWWPTP